MIGADTHSQVGTHLLGVRVTWMQSPGFRAFARLVETLFPSPLACLRVLHLTLGYTQA